jgi:hypothetical protein
MHKQYPITKWLYKVISIAYLALISALAMGSVGPISAAQAAPADATALHFTMRAIKERQVPVCKGELVHISVVVQRDAEDVGDVGDELVNLGSNITGVEVKGLVQNPNIGELSPNTNTTIVAGVMSPNSADFIFTAKNYGETTISFRGLVVTPGWFGSNWEGGAQPVSAFVHVQVIPCAYKVKATLQFPVGIYDITVISDEAVMTADEEGNFTGSTSMYWVYSNFNLDPCTISIGATDSQVDLTGHLDEDNGQLVGTATFQPQTDGGIVTCPGGIGGGTSAFTVAPLTFNVAASGGVATQTATAEGVSGTARIVVVPEEGKAVALNADSRPAPSPSTSWAMLLDNYFPRFYGTLRALP